MHIQVSCIKKRGDHYNPHERIEGLGGVHNGQRWYDLENNIISFISMGIHTYYVVVDGKQVIVIVAEHNQRKYLKTVPDGYAPNNLLNLPECPK